MTQDRAHVLSLKDIQLSERVSVLKDAYFRSVPEICTERPRLVTRFSLENGHFKKDRLSILDKAKLYRYVLENRAPIVRHLRAVDREMQPFDLKDSSLFAGATTSKAKGVILYPEFLALTLWPELRELPSREKNPYYISEQEIRELNFEIFPHWMNHNILELTRKRTYAENLKTMNRKAYDPEIKLLESFVFFIASKPECISHTIPDFSKAVNQGLRSMIEDAEERKTRADTEYKREFFAAMMEVLEGIIAHSNNLAQEAERQASIESDPDLKKELLQLAEIHRRVPELPARNFREGLSTIWICWTAIHLENPNVGLSLGRLDQVLSDLYRQDLDAGVLSLDKAVELVGCLWLKIGDHVPAVPDTGEQLFGGTGSNQAITIGGVDAQGRDAVCELTYVMLRATELMMLRDPNLNARYFQGVNSKEYLRRLCDANITTGATPALHNDRAVIQALTSKGETLEQARDYGVIGCVEPGSNGRHYGHSAAILLNLTSALELTLYNGRHRHTGDRLISKETGDPVSFTSYDQFKQAFREQATWLLEQSTRLNNMCGKTHQEFYPTPILSAFFEGPMDQGKDLIEGGATINSSGLTVIGLADVADSLSAIQHLVFDRKEITFSDLLDALDKDFEGNEALQRRLINPDQTPKYGNDDALADSNVSWLLGFLDGELQERKNYRGGRYRLGCWTMTIHAGFGRLTKALPNGRKAHENFSSGITPVSGVTPWLTKTLNSVANQPPTCLSNGIAFNIKYTPEIDDRESMLDNFVSFVEGYFVERGESKPGGMEIQFNVTTHDTFVDAVKNPDKYPELLVRVSGYTAYFKDLNPQMQKEIIDRTEYLLSSGQAVDFQPFHLPAGRSRP